MVPPWSESLSLRHLIKQGQIFELAYTADPVSMAKGMEQFQLDLGPTRQVYTVAELNTKIRAILDDYFGDIWVSGEISGVRLAASGHYYFVLKDGDSQVKCACFRMNARYLKFKPQDGV